MKHCKHCAEWHNKSPFCCGENKPTCLKTYPQRRVLWDVKPRGLVAIHQQLLLNACNPYPFTEAHPRQLRS